MRTSDRDRDKTNPHDLANLRKRLWRLSSVLTCGVVVVSLIVTWIASAVTAVKSAGTEMAGAFYWDNRSESLLDVRDRAQSTVFEALNASFEPVNRVMMGKTHGFRSDPPRTATSSWVVLAAARLALRCLRTARLLS